MSMSLTSMRDAAIGGLVTLIGSLILAIATGAWAAKENAADHKADIAAVRAELRRILDVVCLDKPQAPQCRESLR
jgi:hypothetical protein